MAVISSEMSMRDMVMASAAMYVHITSSDHEVVQLQVLVLTIWVNSCVCMYPSALTQY